MSCVNERESMESTRSILEAIMLFICLFFSYFETKRRLTEGSEEQKWGHLVILSDAIFHKKKYFLVVLARKIREHSLLLPTWEKCWMEVLLLAFRYHRLSNKKMNISRLLK